MNLLIAQHSAQVIKYTVQLITYHSVFEMSTQEVMSTTFDLISSTDDSEGPFGLRLTYGQLNSVLDILKPQPEQPDYVVENAKFQELNAVINAYHSNGGYFYEGASSCINRSQYDKIWEFLKKETKPVKVIG